MAGFNHQYNRIRIKKRRHTACAGPMSSHAAYGPGDSSILKVDPRVLIGIVSLKDERLVDRRGPAITSKSRNVRVRRRNRNLLKGTLDDVDYRVSNWKYFFSCV